MTNSDKIVTLQNCKPKERKIFTAATPVKGTKFHNRMSELAVLEEVTTRLLEDAPTWLAIIGPRKVGKTSLLLEHARRKSGTCNFMIIDTQESVIGSLEFYRLYALRVLDSFLASDIGASLEVLLGDAETYRSTLIESQRIADIPKLLRSVLLRLVDTRADENLVRSALNLPEQLAHTFDTYAIVAIDEFQTLTQTKHGGRRFDPLPIMRSIWQKHERVSYIISGSSRRMLTSLIQSENSPFFQHFELMEIQPFDTAEGVKLLLACLPDTSKLQEADLHEAVELLGGYPFYLQLLGRALSSSRGPYDSEMIKQSLSELLFTSTGRLSLYFENEYSKAVGRSFYLASVLNTLAKGPKTLSELSKSIKVSSGEASNYIDRLSEYVVRNKEDSTYSLYNPVFGLWLCWRQPGGAALPMTLLGDAAERAVAQHLARLGFELIYQARASRGAFDILAMRGPYQLALQIKRQAVPLRISETDWQRMKSDADRFNWHWLIVSVDPQSEQVLFLDPAQSRGKKYRKIGDHAKVDNLLAWLQDR